jgi:NRAMP (natural resistance-associated macrophage protein)-like metal ion transporter
MGVSLTVRDARASTAGDHSALDPQHVGDITGALGTIRRGDVARRSGWWPKLRTFLAILGPGLIVMVGDNDAGAFGTYTEAGQNYGTTLLWTLLLLVPVLYVNQEMVLRLGVVSGVGHARLILARFGKFWGAFSVIDLFVLNALTIVTEFIGISLGLDFFGVPKLAGIAVAAALIAAGASTGSFRRFEQFSVALCLGSLLLVPVLIAVHAPLGRSVHDLFVPGLPAGADVSTVMLLIIAIVGTTVAPWQLFFQQSYVIDKRITPRFMAYERWDLVIGIVFVMVGGIAMMSFAAGTFAGHKEFGNIQDAGAVAAGIAAYAGKVPAALFAIALIDASIIGAAAVGLSSAYAVGDVLSFRHSLHRKVTDAPVFYAVYLGLIGLAAALVLIPGVPLGLTNAVQTLAGVLLPSATVFLLLLSNDAAVLGPWANTRRVNVFTGVVIAVLVMLSVILTSSVLFPSIGGAQILGVLIAGGIFALVAGIAIAAMGDGGRTRTRIDRAQRATWRMPPLDQLPAAKMTPLTRMWLIVLRAYLVLAVALVVVRVVQLALHRGSPG